MISDFQKALDLILFLGDVAPEQISVGADEEQHGEILETAEEEERKRLRDKVGQKVIEAVARLARVADPLAARGEAGVAVGDRFARDGRARDGVGAVRPGLGLADGRDRRLPLARRRGVARRFVRREGGAGASEGRICTCWSNTNIQAGTVDALPRRLGLQHARGGLEREAVAVLRISLVGGAFFRFDAGAGDVAPRAVTVRCCATHGLVVRETRAFRVDHREHAKLLVRTVATRAPGLFACVTRHVVT